MMSIRPSTPQCSGVPRPFLPTKPTAWLSSTITMASYFSARSQMPVSLAMMPSIENTPSVAISRKRASARLLQLRLEIGHVVVGVAEALRLAQPDAVDDGGVVQRVGDDRVLLAEQRLEQAAVGVEAGGVEDGVLHAEEARDLRLELLVHVLRAADEAHRGHAVAVAVERCLGGLDAARRCRRGRDSCWRRSSAPCRRRRPRSRPTAAR